jgi:hypothetical protein
MLASQEWHMASEGLKAESGCPRCQSGNIQPISETAENEPCRNPGCAVQCFCFSCNSVHDTARLNPLPPCPIKLSILQAMGSASDGTPAQIIISGLIHQATLEACASTHDRYVCWHRWDPERILQVRPASAQRWLLELLWAAINAYLRGEHQTVYQHE